VSAVTDMSYMMLVNGSDLTGNFYYYIDPISFAPESFNADLSDWDVSSVTDMEGAFLNAKSFNSAIGGWDVRKVTTMARMFENAENFNNALVWDSSSVTTMKKMFSGATAFNSELVLDTSNVVTMAFMFSESAFNVDISAWNVESVTDFHYMFSEAPFSPLLCWDLDFTKYINLEGIFSDDDASATAWLDPDAAKCACAAGEFYDGAACVACESGTVSHGKTESCVSCTDLLCPPSPSPTTTAMPTLTPAPTSSSKPSAEPTLAPTANPTMTRITEISSTYVSSPSLKAETLFVEEIYLNGVALAQTSRRLESTNGAMSGVIEELSAEQKTQGLKQKTQSLEQKTQSLELKAMRTLIEKLEIKIQELEARLHAKGTDN